MPPRGDAWLARARRPRRRRPPEIAGSDAPFVTETVVGRCEVCGGTDTRAFAAGYDYELITCRNRWQFAECTACTHVWLDPRPSVEALGVIYPPTYYSYNYEQIPAVARKAKEIIDGLKMRKILALGGRTPERSLDVGCGDGRYLEALARRGVPQSGLFGLELDEQIVGKLQDRGLQVYCERVEECTRFEPGTFDLITMFHVIEHVDSPRAGRRAAGRVARARAACWRSRRPTSTASTPACSTRASGAGTTSPGTGTCSGRRR